MTTSQPGRDWQAIVVAALEAWAEHWPTVAEAAIRAGLPAHLVAALGLPQLEQERDHAKARRHDALADLLEAKTLIGLIWHAMGIPADADADLLAEVRAMRARDKPGCSKAHEELATVEAERDAAREEVRVLTEQLAETKRVLAIEQTQGPADVAIARDRAVRAETEAASWRRVAERLEEEKRALAEQRDQANRRATTIRDALDSVGIYVLDSDSKDAIAAMLRAALDSTASCPGTQAAHDPPPATRQAATMASDLHERLLAEIKRRETVAKAATEGPWSSYGSWPFEVVAEPYDDDSVDAPAITTEVQRSDDSAHIALHDPADALRRYTHAHKILERHHPAVDLNGQYLCWWCSPRCSDYPCPDLLGLADSLAVPHTTTQEDQP